MKMRCRARAFLSRRHVNVRRFNYPRLYRIYTGLVIIKTRGNILQEHAGKTNTIAKLSQSSSPAAGSCPKTAQSKSLAAKTIT